MTTNAKTSRARQAAKHGADYFTELNSRLAKLGFRLWETNIDDPLNEQGFHYCIGILWPVKGKMIRPVWKLVQGQNVRTNARSFEVCAMRKDDFAAKCIRIATQHMGELVANDGHASNDPAQWEGDRFIG